MCLLAFRPSVRAFIRWNRMHMWNVFMT